MIATLLALHTLMTSGTFSELIVVKDLPAFPLDGERTIELSPIKSSFDYREAILSWNVADGIAAYLKIEARAEIEGRQTAWFSLAEWSGDMSKGPRTSIPKQSDADGEVLTDTFRLKRLSQKIQLRLTMRRVGNTGEPSLKLLTISLSDPTALPEDTFTANTSILKVPQLSQMPYENGALKYDPANVSAQFTRWFGSVKEAQYCSPTSLSMVLQYWAAEEKRPELSVAVPAVVTGVFDESYPGTGNWSFNVAFAGSLPDMVAYVTRLGSMVDLKKLLDSGIPVVCSVSYNLLKDNGKPAGGDGHLVVLVGFDDSGDPVFNDPGRTAEVRQTYLKANFAKAWMSSGHTVYLVYPQRTKLPKLSEQSVITS